MLLIFVTWSARSSSWRLFILVLAVRQSHAFSESISTKVKASDLARIWILHTDSIFPRQSVLCRLHARRITYIFFHDGHSTISILAPHNFSNSTLSSDKLYCSYCQVVSEISFVTFNRCKVRRKSFHLEPFPQIRQNITFGWTENFSVPFQKYRTLYIKHI